LVCSDSKDLFWQPRVSIATVETLKRHPVVSVLAGVVAVEAMGLLALYSLDKGFREAVLFSPGLIPSLIIVGLYLVAGGLGIAAHVLVPSLRRDLPTVLGAFLAMAAVIGLVVSLALIFDGCGCEQGG
jgi:hypothetical protein